VPTDFRDGKTFPRRGRDEVAGAMWLLRVLDKARASANGTIHDYIYPCPMDRGVLSRWGIDSAKFDEAIRAHPDDDSIVAWLKATVPAERIRIANEWLRNEKTENLDRQDSEETAPV
jgi:hypothetical protein